MAKITGKILKMPLLIETVWRKTISDLVLLHVRFHKSICRRLYSEVLRNSQVYKYPENFQRFYSCLCCVSQRCFLLSVFLASYNLAGSHISAMIKNLWLDAESFCGVSYSQKRAQRSSLPARSLFPEIQDKFCTLFYYSDDSQERVCLWLSTKQRAWQKCHFRRAHNLNKGQVRGLDAELWKV